MGHKLAGTLTVPKGKGPFPAIVTITGSGSQDRDEEIWLVKGFRPFRQIADSLGRAGIAVLRMDDRGFGGSGGDAATSTSRDFAEDIKAGLAWLRSRPEIDGKRLGLVGHSEGGLIAPIVASEDPALKAIVLMAGPGQTGREILEFQNRYGIEHNPAIKPESRDSAVQGGLGRHRLNWQGESVDQVLPGSRSEAYGGESEDADADFAGRHRPAGHRGAGRGPGQSHAEGR
jgi:dienelactone hydrolase